MDPMKETQHSVTGYAHQTPVIRNNVESRNAIGIRRMHPLEREIIWAGTGCSVEVR